MNRKVNVLLVDDQPGKLLSYEVMLGELDENLIKASSAKQALEILLKADIGVILIDVCMPELDGFELARMIREHPRYQRLAIIFISGIQMSNADFLRGYSAGAVDYVPVPVIPEVLRAKVKVFAELYRTTQDLEDLNRELESRVSERTAALEASAARLSVSEQGRTLALIAGNMGSWEHDLFDNTWLVDEGQCQIFGVKPDVKSLPPGSVRSLFCEEDWERLLQLLRNATVDQRTFQSELRIIRPTGETRWCLVAAAVTFDAQNEPQRVSGVTIDITDRKEAERRQTLLAREVDHRARNALAQVQAILRLSRASTIDDYVVSVEGRIGALALSHELLSQARWQGANISRLVAEELAPYQGGEDSRVLTSGPSIILPADKAQTIALLTHELATNAAKYGALSVQSGRVRVKWELCDRFLILTWVETGGPRIAKPETKGFGSRIIEANLNRREGDDALFEWLPEGLTCTISLSMTTNGDRVAATSSHIVAEHVRPRTVLVVEDEPLIGMMTCELVREMSYGVLGPCRTLGEAMDVARREQFDAAILDVNLGGELVSPLARLLASREIPMILLTGYEPGNVEQEFGMFPLLQKPISPNELKHFLKKVLDESPRGSAPEPASLQASSS